MHFLQWMQYLFIDKCVNLTKHLINNILSIAILFRRLVSLGVGDSVTLRFAIGIIEITKRKIWLCAICNLIFKEN